MRCKSVLPHGGVCFYGFVFPSHAAAWKKHKKRARVTTRALCFQKLLSLGCLNRTCSCAGTAVNASAGVDNSLCVVKGNSTYGTCVYTSTAADALFTDRISHNTNLLYT